MGLILEDVVDDGYDLDKGNPQMFVHRRHIDRLIASSCCDMV